jgi:hypothetical protein
MIAISIKVSGKPKMGVLVSPEVHFTTSHCFVLNTMLKKQNNALQQIKVPPPQMFPFLSFQCSQ